MDIKSGEDLPYPWQDWINDKEKTMETLMSIARMRVSNLASLRSTGSPDWNSRFNEGDVSHLASQQAFQEVKVPRKSLVRRSRQSKVTIAQEKLKNDSVGPPDTRPDEKLTDNYQPTIAWLNKPKKKKIVTCIPNKVETVRRSLDCSEISKNYAFPTRNLTPQESRDPAPLRRRMKTRSGLSCHLLGETYDSQSISLGYRSSRLRRKTCSSDRHIRKYKEELQDQNSKPCKISFRDLLLELLNQTRTRSNRTSTSPSDMSLQGLLQKERHEDWHSDLLDLDEHLQHEGQEDWHRDSHHQDFPHQNHLEESAAVARQRLADDILDELIMELVEEVASFCTTVVDNLVSVEFGFLESD